MKHLLIGCLLLLAGMAMAQPPGYQDSILAFRNRYTNTHGALDSAEKAQLRFFPVDAKYYVTATVEPVYEAPWFAMETSGTTKKTYRIWAILHFTLNGMSLKLAVYQSQQLLLNEVYKNYLFIPFTDLSNGLVTYENGRYIDCTIDELASGRYYLDFNKAYNPYCAYIKNNYNCPIPPAENHLPVQISAGEKKWALSEPH